MQMPKALHAPAPYLLIPIFLDPPVLTIVPTDFKLLA